MTTRWQSPCGRVDWRLGRYQTALADVVRVDSVITDPPYSAVTHKGHNAMAKAVAASITQGAGTNARRALSYAHFTDADVREFVSRWAPACQWFLAMSDDELALTYKAALRDANRTVFAPLPLVKTNGFRLTGDGPVSSAIWLSQARRPVRIWGDDPHPSTWSNVGRAKRAPLNGSLPGYYMYTPETGGRIGGKPIALMLEIVGHYSRPCDLVCDPCGGYATTGVAALRAGRRFIGAECDPEAWEIGRERLERELAQTTLAEAWAESSRAISRAKNGDIFGGEK